MTTFGRLCAVRAALAVGVVLRAVAWGSVAALTLVVGSAVADLLVPLSVGARVATDLLALGAATAVALSVAWKDRAVWSIRRVALWVEERFPHLEYALVTAVETGRDSLAAPSGAWPAEARRRGLRALRAPAASLVIVGAALLLLPHGAVARVARPRAGDALDRPGAGRGAASRLTPLVAEVVPPAYTGGRPTIVDDPTDVRALAGSTLILRGRGAADGITALVSGDSSAPVRAATAGARWEMAIHLPAHPVAVRLADRNSQRLIAVEVVADSAPVVVLSAPGRDTLLRLPKGRIPLSATATDDIGLRSAQFEYIVSSGEGETFTFRSGIVRGTDVAGRRASIAGSLSIDSLQLHAGDVIHVRAVARDGNSVTGPGVGASDTRTIRIARADEYDSVAVEAAAPSEADKSIISERMLILLAETLDRNKPRLPRDSVVKESRAIAADQRALRRSVGDIVFTRLGGNPTGEEHTDDTPARARDMATLLARADSATNRSADPIDFGGGESPVVAVSAPLLEAYNAMWDATTALELAEPGSALPHMRRALAAIQRARQAERVYLRGTPPPVVVDVARARLTGKDKGTSSVSHRSVYADSASRSRAERFARIVELAGRDARAAADSLLLLRIDVLPTDAPFAAALGDAASAIRRGRGAEASQALARARRVLSGPAARSDSLSRWGVLP